MGDVGLGAEAAAAHADAVLVAEDGGHEAVVHTVDGEGDDAHLRAGAPARRAVQGDAAHPAPGASRR